MSGLIALLVLLAPVPWVQEPIATFTITATTANVRQQPSTASTIVGKLPRGVEVDVMSSKNGWVRISFDDDRGRLIVGYVAEFLGVSKPRLPVAAAAAPAAPVQAPVDAHVSLTQPRPEISASEPAPTQSAPASQIGAGPRLPLTPPPDRALGLGGRVGGFTFGVGGSLRMWTSDAIGLQFDFSRYSIGGHDSFGGISVGLDYSVMQFGPSVLYRFDTVADDGVWIRPYVGGGLNFFRTKLSTQSTVFGETEVTSESQNNMGFQVVGGAETRFQSVRRLGLSADLGYYSTGTPFAGLQIGGFAYGVSVHWYLK